MSVRPLSEEDTQLAINLKATLWATISNIVDSEMKRLAYESRREGRDATISTSVEFQAALVELVYRQIVTVGRDLEAFAKHAKRKVINTDDMFMVTRKNQALTSILKQYLDHYEEEDQAKKSQKSQVQQEKNKKYKQQRQRQNERQFGHPSSSLGSPGSNADNTEENPMEVSSESDNEEIQQIEVDEDSFSDDGSYFR